jgi:glycosyltransferase involved in cell wall biosynthesis
MTPAKWAVLQIGAREHYAVARALHREGLLDQLLTDCWVPPRSALARLPQAPRLVGRYHSDLATAQVMNPWLGNLPFELSSRFFGAYPPGWPRTMARNVWFQRWACNQLRRIRQPAPNLFSYSYAARSLFRLGRQRGQTCILGQIDPGPEEEQLVLAEHRRYPILAGSWQPAPPSYWQHWAEELELADRIVVNSPWSRDCLLRQGVSASKLHLIPLVYEASQALPLSQQPTPASAAQPFQLLFLGTIGLRKGIGRLLEAMRLLEQQPVQLTLAGPSELDPQAWAGAPNIRWLGPVPRSDVDSIYRQAQAMILPTLSDGFAITQLEALAHGCPVIVSQHCGEVVTPGLNGWILASLEPEEIAANILQALEQASALPRPLVMPRFGLADLAGAMQALARQSF